MGESEPGAVFQRQRKRGLTLRQASAIDLLVCGHTDAPAGPTDPEAALREIVEGRRAAPRSPLHEALEVGSGLPPFEEHVEQVRRELDALASEEAEGGEEG